MSDDFRRPHGAGEPLAPSAGHVPTVEVFGGVMVGVKVNVPRGVRLVVKETELERNTFRGDVKLQNESEATVEFYRDTAGKDRWRLVAPNGEIIADGSQGYSSTAAAQLGFSRVQHYLAKEKFTAKVEK